MHLYTKHIYPISNYLNLGHKVCFLIIIIVIIGNQMAPHKRILVIIILQLLRTLFNMLCIYPTQNSNSLVGSTYTFYHNRQHRQLHWLCLSMRIPIRRWHMFLFRDYSICSSASNIYAFYSAASDLYETCSESTRKSVTNVQLSSISKLWVIYSSICGKQLPGCINPMKPTDHGAGLWLTLSALKNAYVISDLLTRPE